MITVRNGVARRASVPVTAALLALSVVSPGAADDGVRAEVHGTTRLVSVNSAGVQADEGGYGSISADGHVVVFESDATNLRGHADRPRLNVFVHHLRSGTTRRVSVRWDGPGPAVSQPAASADGRTIAFVSEWRYVRRDHNHREDVYVRDLRRHTTRLVSMSSSSRLGNGHSRDPAVSADGRFVAFESEATNLVAADRNGAPDVFIRDLRRGITRRVSTSRRGEGNYGSHEPDLSADGRYVAFTSMATNLVAGDTNQSEDVFVRDRHAHTTRRVSVGSDGGQLVGEDAASYQPSISGDGRYVAFTTPDEDLAPPDILDTEDVFVHDRVTGVTEPASVIGHSQSDHAMISADGRYVAFVSSGPTLVPGDTNQALDVFVRDRLNGTLVRVSVSSTGTQGTGDSSHPSVSAHGRHIGFVSAAEDLVPGDVNQQADVFLRDFPFASP